MPPEDAFILAEWEQELLTPAQQEAPRPIPLDETQFIGTFYGGPLSGRSLRMPQSQGTRDYFAAEQIGPIGIASPVEPYEAVEPNFNRVRYVATSYNHVNVEDLTRPNGYRRVLTHVAYHLAP